MTTTDAPVVEPQAPAEPTALLSSLRIIRPGNAPSPVVSSEPEPEPSADPVPETPVTPETSTSEPEKTDATPEPEKKEDAPEKKPETTPEEDPTKGMSETASKKFKGILKRAEKAEQERDEHHKAVTELRAEYEALKTQTAEFDTLRKDALRALEEAETYKKQLKEVAIERDPEFQQEFNGKILAKQTSMLQMAVAAGAQQADFVAAINNADEEALEAFRDTLAPHQQRAWDNARLEIDNLAAQRKEAIGNPDKTIAEMQKSRQERAAAEVEQTRRENISMTRTAVADIWKENEGLSNPDPSLAEEINATREDIEKKTAHVVAHAERPQIIRMLAEAFLLEKNREATAIAIESMKKDIEAKDKEIEEMKEKMGEQETFIKNASRQVPRVELGGNKSPATQNGSLLSAVRVRIPGQ